MTRHLMQLMWNRKRQNLLLMVEIFVAFLVVVAVSVTGIHFGYNAMQPLGFSHEDVWALNVQRGRVGGELSHEAGRETFRQVMAEAAGRPEIEHVSGAFAGPYSWYSWGDSVRPEGRSPISTSVNRTDDAYAAVLGIELLDGRWFTREDDRAWGENSEPVVINRRLAMDVFGRENVAGETIIETAEDSGERGRPKRVVGVVGDFRQFGELSTPSPVLFYRRTIDAPADYLELPDVVLMKVRPGTTAAFEETLLRRLQTIAPAWSFGIEPVTAMRESMLRANLVPLIVVSIIAGAMLLMVALGLTGVVWQSVTQRMREFGLRRAHGATGMGVGRQVIAELIVMTTFAVALACLLLVQIPLLPLPTVVAVIPSGVFIAGVALAIIAVYSVTILCAWYPSRLATRVPPAEALRYE